MPGTAEQANSPHENETKQMAEWLPGQTAGIRIAGLSGLKTTPESGFG